MKELSIALLVALLLILSGCGEKVAGNKPETAASAVPTITIKELTPEEKFAETKKKAEAGDVNAQYNLSRMYILGDGVPKDEVKALEWLQKAVVQGDADAQYVLGNMYYSGYLSVLPKDIAKALEWYQKAAAQGNADAQFNLARMYGKGEGVPQDVAKALEWIQKAAAQGHAEAQYGLGDAYRSGIEGLVPKDAAKAVEWFQKAAAQGHEKAQMDLARMYDKGEGVPKNAVKAVEWYQKAAAQGDANAQYNLALKHGNGEGVPKNDAKSLEWTQKAAAQYEVLAMFRLISMYGHLYSFSNGQGVPKDYVLAYAWANVLAGQSSYAGSNALKVSNFAFVKNMSAAEIAEAQRLSSAWKKGQVIVREGRSASASTPSTQGTLSKQATGTAFAVSNEGHALTNHHVVEGCAELKIAGREGITKVITSDSVNDLALLQLPGKTKDVANLNPDPGKLRQGEDIIVFGYPLNSVLSSGGNLTPGTLSALTGLGNNTSQIQITAPIQPGSSGSPVMDKKGNVVGVVSMKLDDAKMAKATGQIGQNVNFAVNGQTVKAFLDANKVPYKTGGGFFSREKSNADIAEEASKWTVLVECWK